MVEGFQEGFDWAPVIAAEIFGVNVSTSNVTIRSWIGGSSAGRLDIELGGNGGVSFGGMFVVNGVPFGVYDWGKHYYDIGYTGGNDKGLVIGSEDGYNLAYPVAYAAAYKIGYKRGTFEGVHAGFREGSEQGYNDGWSEGNGIGFDAGFYAGLDYHLFGDFYVPQYSLDYSRRSTGTAPIPEPTSLTLVGLAFVIGFVRRSAQR